MYRPTCCFRLPSKLHRRARRSRLLTMALIFFTILSLLFPFYIIYKPPTLLIKYFQHRWPDVLWHVSTSSKIVALTIDDAPSAYTLQIKDILKENDAKATFFIIGGQVNGKEKEEVLEEVVKDGMELGNHAMRDEASRSLSDADLIHQIETVEAKINAAYDAVNVDHPPRYFRPGSGFFSKRMRQKLEMLKYRLVLGDIYPHDPQIPYPSVNANHILSMLKPGAIIICHDRRSWTVPMLKKVVPEIKRRGYEITTITGLVNGASAERQRVT